MATPRRKKRPPLLDEAEDRAPPVTERRLVRLYQYWLAQRGARRMPSRADIDPLEMRFILGHLMLIDVSHPGPEFRVRLQGSELSWWIGQELTGMNLSDVPSLDLETLARRQFEHVVATAEPLGWIGNDAIDGIRRQYQAIILPLSSEGKFVDLLMVAVRCGSGEPGI
ncbi:MAG TPA: PAS domain-containing protein [Stellaceae bacterium]|nr:PAS domain-containing protein [Stellaceae bacterium]